MTSKVYFEVYSGLYCEFLNYLVEKEIFLSLIKSTDFGFTATCMAKDYKKIARAAKNFQCKTKIIRKNGLYFKSRKVLARKGIVLSAALVFLYVFLFSKLIWRIDIIAPSKNITEDVNSILYENNCYAGAVFNQEKNQNIIQKIFMDVDNVGYVTLNFYKGILTCKVDATINKMPYLENSTSGNITASLDGVIEELEIYNGFSDIQIGQTVLKGDILVEPTYVDRNGTLQQVMPRAFIKAYCLKEYSAQTDFNKEVSIRTGKYTEQVSLKFIGKKILIKKADIDAYKQYESEKYFENITILGFSLPLTKETIRFYEKESVNIEKDEQSAYDAAKKAVDTTIKSDTSLLVADKYEYYSKTTEDGVTVFCRVYGHYDITV
ncbi:MAG: sporulation protein YqfD [Oscillospiraceae bacterium]|nr:sporulation protein YqfD [Oscillospiraceae bacterium]